MHNETDWTSLIVCRYSALKDKIETFKTHLAMADQRDSLTPVDDMLVELLEHKDTLEHRAMDENVGTAGNSNNCLITQDNRIDVQQIPENE